MDSGDLFSFLDETAGQSDSEDVNAMDTAQPDQLAKKRKIRSTYAAEPDTRDVEMDNEPGPSTKKSRLSSPKPIVLDEFETEAKREVARSAGLENGVEAGRLELKHQVRHFA